MAKPMHVQKKLRFLSLQEAAILPQALPGRRLQPPLPPADPILRLPCDVLCRIFRYLCFADLVVCLRVCRTWYNQLILVRRLWRRVSFPASRTPPSARAISRAIHLGGHQLRSLTIGSAEKLTNGCLVALAKVVRPHLTSLGIMHAHRLDMDCLVTTVATLAHSLTHLSLSGTAVTDHTMRQIFSRCPSLCDVDISYCAQLSRYMFEGITPQGPAHPAKCSRHAVMAVPPLVRFTARGIGESAHQGIWNSLCHYYHTTLSALDWTDTGRISLGMVNSLSLCTQLRVLNLNGCTLADDELTQSLPLLGEQCNQIEELRLAGMTMLHDHHLMWMVGLNHNLRVLDLTNLHQLSDVLLRPLSTQLPQLTHLTLHGCFHCSDVGVSHILKRCPQLRHLDVTKTTVTDILFGRLARYSKSLETLVLDSCLSITAQGLSTLLTRPNFIRQLRYLSLANCTRVDYDTALKVRNQLHPDAQFRYYFKGDM
ncbi:hypothetical protein H4R35_001380 [Dimargaris xerosporica]|nr:hypothetical protein H4R35_001380 [Dimargaris xerosporica]